VIGRINGHAFGGGLGLTAACDLTIAADAPRSRSARSVSA
jgi:enoyl-CoA hydratase/carnithine racemase